MNSVFGAVVQRAPVAPVTVNPLIQLKSAFVVVKKSYTSPARVVVTLKVSSNFRRSGTISRTVTPTSGDIHIFTTATGTTEIDFVTNTNTTFSAAQLNAGVRLFAEAEKPSLNLDDFQLTLTLAPGPTPIGPPATATLTAVQLGLDVRGTGVGLPVLLLPQPPDPPPAPGTATDKWFGGRVLNVQDPGNQQDRAEIVVDTVLPTAFAGDLVLRQVKVNKSNQITGLDTKVQLFDSRTPGPLQLPPIVETPKANPFVFNAGTIGPIGQSFFAEGHLPSALPRDTGFQLGINGVENDGDRISMTVVVAPLLSVDAPFVVVKKPHTKPARRIITLKTSAPSTLKGTLTKAGAGPIQIFTTAAGATEITFNGTDNVFTGAQLGSAAGVKVFAESTTPSTTPEDFELTLTLSGGGALPLAQPVTVKLTAVEITLDVAQTRTSANVVPPRLSSTEKINPGAFVIVQDAGPTHERALLVVQPPKPSVSLTLRLEALNASVQAFADEKAALGQAPVPNPNTILTAILPVTGSQVFIEGKTASSALFDTGFRLGIDGVENDADRVVVTVFPDPSLPGPFAVGEHEYTRAAKLAIPATTETLSDLAVLDVGPPAAHATGAFNAAIHALVRYPATAAGADKPVSGVLAKYPLVVIAHGNHAVVDSLGTPVESFRGLEYLARHLASYGYIAISIDLDVVNTALGFIFPGIVQRGLVVLEHIAFWNVLNTTDPIFTGKVDLSQIGLIGHSRGGEAVVSAQKTNIDQGRGLSIKAVTSISQTDFLGIVHSTTPYLVIYGSADGDVSIGWPFRLYDRAAPFKALVFVYGANHNRFSTSPDWLANLDLDPVVDGRIISEADHLSVAKGYCLGFLQLILRSVGDHMLLFKNNARPSAVSGAVEMHGQVQDQPPRLTVDDFEQGAFAPAVAHGAQLAGRATTNTLGQTVSQTGLAVPAAPGTNPAINSLSNALTEGSLRHRDLDFFWNDTFGELLAWDVVGATYTQPLGTKDVSSFDVLSFRVTQRFGVARNPAPPAASPDFSITLKDAAGQTAAVRVGTLSTVPIPYVRVDDPSLTKSALTTIRMPLAAFSSVNALLNLSSLAAIIFQFAQTAKGEIAIDDLEFSN
jgi:hypothetical protein